MHTVLTCIDLWGILAIQFPQCYTNIQSYIILSEVSSYAQNQRQQEPCHHFR